VVPRETVEPEAGLELLTTVSKITGFVTVDEH
jgi:hypothetical protein